MADKTIALYMRLSDEDDDKAKNLVNAMYCKDASRKVRSAKLVLAKQGKYIASFLNGLNNEQLSRIQRIIQELMPANIS